MKIAVYGIWEAERAMLESMSKELGFEYTVTTEPISRDNLGYCDGCDGVSSLGKVDANAALMAALAKRGV